MSTHKYFNKICVAVTILALVLTVLFMNGKKLGLTSVIDEDAETYEDSKYFTSNDKRSDWDESDATIITLNGDSCKIKGNGAYWNENKVVITGGGYYVISGELTDGSIVVDAYESSKIYIKLKGVNISCSDNACLRVEQADKVFVTLAEGTDNSFESGEEYCDEALEDGTGGVIFAHDDLTINGDGNLTVTAAYKHGIDANDDLIIAGGNITISAPKDAIHVNDSVRIVNADITVDAKDDGIVTAKEDSYVYIESGTLSITCSDDGIHSAGNVLVAGGELNITACDDGIHSDTNVTVSDGYINIPSCYEGIEALTIDVTGGEIEIYPTDDGFNANGGSGDAFGNMQPPDMNNTDNTAEKMPEQNISDVSVSENSLTEDSHEDEKSTEDSLAQNEEEETYIKISGGKITIVNETGQDADGLDSNGSIFISGGEIFVSLSGNGTNNAIDYGSENNGICEINGGTIIACGGSGMIEEISTTSTQASIMYNLSTTAEADTTVKLTSSDGTEFISHEVPCSYSSVVISTPDMEQGETYTLTLGETTEEITLESVVGTYGTAVSTMGGMPMNMNGDNTTESQTDNTDSESSSNNQTMRGPGGTPPDMSDGNMPDMSNFTPPDMNKSTDTDRSEAGSDASNGTDITDSFTPPDMSDFTPPDMNNGSAPQNFQPGQNMNKQNAEAQDNEADESTEDSVTTYSSQKEVTSDEWMWLGVAAGVLLLGILVAVIYKRW